MLEQCGKNHKQGYPWGNSQQRDRKHSFLREKPLSIPIIRAGEQPQKCTKPVAEYLSRIIGHLKTFYYPIYRWKFSLAWRVLLGCFLSYFRFFWFGTVYFSWFRLFNFGVLFLLILSGFGSFNFLVLVSLIFPCLVRLIFPCLVGFTALVWFVWHFRF
jgi:hypothetical protein